MQQAEEFIKNLDGNALDYLIASWEGFKDGNINFVDGCIDYFTADGVVSDFEYAMMYKVMLLSAEDNEYTQNLSAEHKFFLSQCYSVMQSTGNMTIPVLLSVVNPKLGRGAMVLSSSGNATKQAIQNEIPTYKAYLYGTALGVSEAFTEKYAGGIPGLSDIDDLIVYNMVKEGAQEAGQTWIDAGFKRFILGEEIDVNSTTVESMTAAYQGFWVSGIFQGPNIYRNIKTTVQPKLMETGATLGHLKIAETPSVDMANNNVSNIESTSTSNSSNIDGTIETLYSTDESNAQANDALTNNDSEGLLNALANNDSEGLLNALANMSLDNRIEFVRTLSDTNQINTTLQLFTELEVEQLAGTLGAEYSARGININEFLNLPTEIQSEILLRTNPNMVTEAYPTLIKNIDFVDMDVLDSLYKILPPNYKATMLTDILTTNDIRNEFYSKGKLGDISIETLQQYEAAINAEVIQSWNLSNHIYDYFKNDKTYNSLSQEKQQKLREVTMESLELAIFVYEHNISTATMTISQMISQRDYYNVPIDQVLQEKIKAKTIKGYKIPQKQIIINGNNYTSYFPSMDYYISDSRVLSYMKAITNDPGVQACNSLQEMGSYLKSRTSMGKPVTIDAVTFQTTRIGSANFERFNAFGIAYIENGNPQYGGMFTFSINDLEKMATNYSQYCKYEDGKFTILDYKNFGSKVLGGVPLSNDGGAFMITTNIPINNSNLALPSVMNERAYLVDNIPGGNLPETSSGYKPTEITIKGNKLTENQTDGVLWGIAENDVGVIEINGMTYSVQELRKEK